MPFKSEKQRRYLYANKPEVAEEFAKKERRGRNKKKELAKRRKKNAKSNA